VEFIVLLFLFALSLQQLRVTRYTANGFAREGRYTDGWFQSIRKNTRQQDLILVITHLRKYFETSVSFKAYLDIELDRKNTLFSPASLAIEPTKHTFWNHLNQPFFSSSPGFRLSNPGDGKRIQAILIFPGLEKKFLEAPVQWFPPAHFERYTNAGGYVSYYKSHIGPRTTAKSP
jgi:hypothetical protein